MSCDESATSSVGELADRSDSVLVLLTSTQARGAEIEGSSLCRRLGGMGIRTRLAALERSSDHTVPVDTVLGPARLSSRTIRALRKAAEDSSIVIAFGSTTLPACAIALFGTSTPFLYRSIGDPSEWLRGPLHRRRTAIMFRRSAHVVALWPEAGDSIHALHGVPRSHISTIPNARDDELFHPATPDLRRRSRTALGLAPHAPVVAMVGALAPEKRVDIGIRAVAGQPGVHLVVAGDGPCRGELEALAARVAPDRIHLLGRVDDPASILQAADAALLTSRTEGLPGVVIEAGLCGLPVVTSDVGGVREIVIDGRTGLVLDDVDESSVARALVAAIERREDLGSAAREHVAARFTWDAVVPQWADVMARVVERSRAG